jgi:hypothetical protein
MPIARLAAMGLNGDAASDIGDMIDAEVKLLNEEAGEAVQELTPKADAVPGADSPQPPAAAQSAAVPAPAPIAAPAPSQPAAPAPAANTPEASK